MSKKVSRGRLRVALRRFWRDVIIMGLRDVAVVMNAKSIHASRPGSGGAASRMLFAMDTSQIHWLSDAAGRPLIRSGSRCAQPMTPYSP